MTPRLLLNGSLKGSWNILHCGFLVRKPDLQSIFVLILLPGSFSLLFEGEGSNKINQKVLRL